jgi:hypothetical protein
VSFKGPDPAAWPLRNASRLDCAELSGLVVGDFCAEACAFDALGFSVVHLGSGGFAGLLHALNSASDNKPQVKIKFPLRTDMAGSFRTIKRFYQNSAVIVKHPIESVN